MQVLHTWITCSMFGMFLLRTDALDVSYLEEKYGTSIQAVLCILFNDDLCKYERGRGNPQDASDAIRNVLVRGRAQQNICSPYSCTDKPKIAPINLCIAIQKSCTVSYSEVKWAYEHAKGLIKTINNAAMISTVIYSDKAKVQPKIRRLQGKRVKGALLRKFKPKKDEECEDCKSNTKDAIQKCWEEFNRTKNTLQDVMIIYTDGVSFDTRFNLAEERNNTLKKAKESHEKNIQTFVIKYKNQKGSIKGDVEWNALNNPGVLKDLQHPEPMSLTKDFKASTFLTDYCEAIPDCTQKPPQCGKIDLVLIIDRSNSIQFSDIKRTIKFLSNMVKNLQVDSDHIRVGIISYNQIVYVHSDVNEALSKVEVLARIDEIPSSNA
ncbi:unnamed protein product, partial [Owenia fusiformis]